MDILYLETVPDLFQGRVVVAWLATLLVQKLNDGGYGPDDDMVLICKTVWLQLHSCIFYTHFSIYLKKPPLLTANPSPFLKPATALPGGTSRNGSMSRRRPMCTWKSMRQSCYARAALLDGSLKYFGCSSCLIVGAVGKQKRFRMSPGSPQQCS